MHLSCLSVLAAAAAVSLAATPAGFPPATQDGLTVDFNGVDATGGKEVSKAGKNPTATRPSRRPWMDGLPSPSPCSHGQPARHRHRQEADGLLVGHYDD